MRYDLLDWCLDMIVVVVLCVFTFFFGAYKMAIIFTEPILSETIDLANKACSTNNGLVSINRNFWKSTKLDIKCKNNGYFSIGDVDAIASK